MSLTEDIAQLVARTNTLLATFEAKEAAINNAVQSAINGAGSLYREVWVDPVKGNDANTGLSPSAAFLTIDRAFEATPHVPSVTISLLGDVTIRKKHTTFSSAITIRGMDGVNDQKRVLRTVSFSPTASNSPNIYGNSYPAGVELQSRVGLRLDYVSLIIPDTPSTVTNTNVFGVHYGMAFIMAYGTLSAEKATTSAVLFQPWWAAPLEVWCSNVAIADSARGHILSGVAANANPHLIANYRSNLTAL